MNTKIIFRPNKIEKDKNYKVRILNKTLSFIIKSPKIEKISFNKSKKEIIIDFNKPIESDYFLEILKIEPYWEGNFLFENPAQVIFQPKEIKEGENYKIKILRKVFIFKTEPPFLFSTLLPLTSSFFELPLIELTSEKNLLKLIFLNKN